MSCLLVLLPMPVGLGLCYWGIISYIDGNASGTPALMIAGILAILMTPFLIIVGPSLTRAAPVTTLEAMRAARARRKPPEVK